MLGAYLFGPTGRATRALRRNREWCAHYADALKAGRAFWTDLDEADVTNTRDIWGTLDIWEALAHRTGNLIARFAARIVAVVRFALTLLAVAYRGDQSGRPYLPCTAKATRS
jgi:hypothetical protein